jgi:deazaflavin-dependent oxidoreductase (nitroreductase family)
MTSILQRAATGVHTGVLRLSRGRLTGRIGKAPVLVLVTVGARSGKRRAAPLLYLGDGDAFAIIASNGGAAAHPGWYHNILSDPEVEVEVNGRTLRCSAEVVTGPDRERLWKALTALYAGYDRYQERTARAIPVVRLHPHD